MDPFARRLLGDDDHDDYDDHDNHPLTSIDRKRERKRRSRPSAGRYTRRVQERPHAEHIRLRGWSRSHTNRRPMEQMARNSSCVYARHDRVCDCRTRATSISTYNTSSRCCQDCRRTKLLPVWVGHGSDVRTWHRHGPSEHRFFDGQHLIVLGHPYPTLEWSSTSNVATVVQDEDFNIYLFTTGVPVSTIVIGFYYPLKADFTVSKPLNEVSIVPDSSLEGRTFFGILRDGGDSAGLPQGVALASASRLLTDVNIHDVNTYVSAVDTSNAFSTIRFVLGAVYSDPCSKCTNHIRKDNVGSIQRVRGPFPGNEERIRMEATTA